MSSPFSQISSTTPPWSGGAAGIDINGAAGLFFDNLQKLQKWLMPTQVVYDDNLFLGTGSMRADMVGLDSYGTQANTDLIFTTETGTLFPPISGERTSGGAAPGAIAVITLDAGSVFTLDGLFVSAIEEGNIYGINGTPYSFRVNSVTKPTGSATHTMTVQPEQNIALDTLLLDSVSYTFVSRSKSDATDREFGGSLYRQFDRFTHGTGYLQTTQNLTSDDYRQFTSFLMTKNTTVPGVVFVDDIMTRHESDKHFGVLFGSGTVQNGAPSTLGVWNYITTFGEGIVLPPGLETISDVQDMVLSAKIRQAGQGLLKIYSAQNRKSSFDTLYENSTSKFDIPEKRTDQIVYAYGTKGIMIDGAQVEFKEWLELNSNRMSDITVGIDEYRGNYWQNVAAILPSDKVQTFDRKTQKNVTVPMFQVISKGVPQSVSLDDQPALLPRRTYFREPTNINSEKYQLTLAEDYGVAGTLVRKAGYLVPTA